MTPIGPHLTAFLREYIPNQREMSSQTSDTYALPSNCWCVSAPNA
jgi:hypothetical protein